MKLPIFHFPTLRFPDVSTQGQVCFIFIVIIAILINILIIHYQIGDNSNKIANLEYKNRMLNSKIEAVIMFQNYCEEIDSKRIIKLEDKVQTLMVIQELHGPFGIPEDHKEIED